VFYLALKRIETAIASGRLDEAFELLMETPERGHREGQRVTGVLTEQLVRRCERHLCRKHFKDASADADKAFRLAGRTDEVAQLLETIARREQQQRAERVGQREAAQAAKIQAQLGLFTLGHNLLQPGPEHSKLAADIERDRKIVDAAAGRIRQAIELQDFHAGIEVLNSLDEPLRRHRLLADRLTGVIQPMLAQGQAEFAEGRLDRAYDILRLLSPVAAGRPPFVELQDGLERCFRAFKFIHAARYGEADQELALVQQTLGRCSWIKQAREALSEQIRLASILRTGPLGLLDGRAPPEPTLASARGPMSGSLSHAAAPSDHPLVLRVDGLGAILLLPSDVVSIGSASQSQQYQIPIHTEGPATPLRIRRTGGDYFAESESEFRINDRTTRRRLLSTGDAIEFGRRGRLKFHRPVAASGSAVLHVTGAGLSKREIRSIALMDDSLLFCKRRGHFSIADADAPIVVFLGPTGYAIKYAGPGSQPLELRIGHSVLLGDTRFTINQINLS
jgi:hypothetical protein